jgi:nicotinamidase-related amidase
MTNPTLRTLTGMDPKPAPISKSALVLIDCQQTYREGVMRLEHVEAALKEAATLLQRFRKAGRPVIHIMHDAGSGSPYDIAAPIGQIADVVAPVAGETVIVKKFPSAFEQTELDAELKKRGVENVVYVGFMTHMCVNSTARASFNHGFANTVVASATATRAIPNPATGKDMPAQQLRMQAFRRSPICLLLWFRPARALLIRAGNRIRGLEYAGSRSETDS